MRIPLAIPFLLALALAAGCAGTSPSEEPPSTALEPLPCTCGTPDADLAGCACACCLAGEANPANPRCVCGGLEAEGVR